MSRWLSQKSPAWSNLTSHHAQRALRGLFARQRVIYRFTDSERTAAGQDLSPLPSWWWMSGELSKSEHRVTTPENALITFNFFKIKKIDINRTKCNRDFRSCSIEAIHIINRIQWNNDFSLPCFQINGGISNRIKWNNDFFISHVFKTMMEAIQIRIMITATSFLSSLLRLLLILSYLILSHLLLILSVTPAEEPLGHQHQQEERSHRTNLSVIFTQWWRRWWLSTTWCQWQGGQWWLFCQVSPRPKSQAHLPILPPALELARQPKDQIGSWLEFVSLPVKRKWPSLRNEFVKG